ncbi:MAG: hypothetical protein V9G29_20340 [Burkholderiaceae bacterium]
MARRCESNDTKPSGLSAKIASSCSPRCCSRLTSSKIIIETASMSSAPSTPTEVSRINPSSTWRREISAIARDCSSARRRWSSACCSLMSRQASTCPAISPSGARITDWVVSTTTSRPGNADSVARRPVHELSGST